MDIDLVYIPVRDREESLTEIKAAFKNISEGIKQSYTKTIIDVIPFDRDGHSVRLIVRRGGVQVKVEISPVLRGTVFPCEEKEPSKVIQKLLGYASIQLVSHADLYAGKMVAALDRQHPRDFFDLMLLFNNEGVDTKLWQAFLVYLICHNRPMSEILKPNFHDFSDVFKKEFEGMTDKPISIQQLVDSREELMSTIHQKMTINDKVFLLSVKRGEPDWTCLPHLNISELPAVQWKLSNLSKMKNREKAYSNLEEVLDGMK